MFTRIYKCQAFKQNHLIFKELFQVGTTLFYVSPLAYMVRNSDILQRSHLTCIAQMCVNFLCQLHCPEQEGYSQLLSWLTSLSHFPKLEYTWRRKKKKKGKHQVSQAVLFPMFARFAWIGWGSLKSTESMLRQQEGTCCASFHCEFTLTQFSSLIPE